MCCRTLPRVVKLGTVYNWCQGQPTSGLEWVPGWCQRVRWANMWQASMQLLYTYPDGMWGQTVGEDFSSRLPIWFSFLCLNEWKTLTKSTAEGGGKKTTTIILVISFSDFWLKKTLKLHSLVITTGETVNCLDVVLGLILLSFNGNVGLKKWSNVH